MRCSRPSAFGRWSLARVALAIVIGALLVSACGEGNDEASVERIAESDRVTITLALHDGVGHRAAMYAIEQSIVTSDTVDVVPNYLSSVDLEEATQSKQFDVVEAPPLAVPLGKTENLDLIVLSAGLQDVDGTMLFVASDADFKTPSDLNGKTFGVASRGDPSTLETRFLLHQRYDIEAGVLENGRSGDVTIDVAPAQSLPALLESGALDAVIATQRSAYEFARLDGVRELSNVTAELREQLDEPIANSVLVTYPDIVASKAEALTELNRLLSESVTYFKANRDAVLEPLATELSADPAFLRWWWDRYDLPLGDRSEATQERLLQAWEAARVLGDVEGYPDLATVLFNPKTAGTPTPKARRTPGG